MTSFTRDDGVVLSWLARVLAVLAVLGVILFDAGSITTNYFGLQTTADEIASTLSTLERTGQIRNSVDLEAQARVLADEADAHVVSAVMDTQGVIHVRLRRKARTLFVGLIDPIRHWARATAEARSSSQ